MWALVMDHRKLKTYYREVDTREEAVEAIQEITERLIGDLPDQVEAMVDEMKTEGGPIRIKLPGDIRASIEMETPLMFGEEA